MNTSLWWIVVLAAVIAATLVMVWARRSKRPQTGLPDGVSLRYTNHARERMSERGVTEAQVASALARSDRHEKDPVENSVRFERDFSGRTLKVWMAEPWPPTSEAVVKSTAWHYHESIRIPADRVGALIGRKGSTIQEIRTATGARISVDDDGTVRISADDNQSVQAAKSAVKKVVAG